jgi:hypothetical protein
VVGQLGFPVHLWPLADVPHVFTVFFGHVCRVEKNINSASAQII